MIMALPLVSLVGLCSVIMALPLVSLVGSVL